jgi:bis(5'-nucleosyl)-tetraphosphatase (symmetrical)
VATYAIGDIQGCLSSLQQLINKIQFRASHDRLWFVGDLVNRGPDSLSVLRWVKALGPTAVVVLGNHDLHLLAAAEGARPIRKDDTFQDVLAAPDRDDLLHWLRQRPLLHRQDKFVFVHAGLLPQWTVEEAEQLAREVEQVLQSADFKSLLQHMTGSKPGRWSPELTGAARYRVIINALTRLRLCTVDGEMEFSYTGPPLGAPPGYVPWFDVPTRRSRDATVISGHWAALGLVMREDLIALDTGCVWGGSLSAVRLEDRAVFQVACAECGASSQGES